MDPRIIRYVRLASAIADVVGAAMPIISQLRQVLTIVTPDHDLTDVEINAIEVAGVADSSRRRDERLAMSLSTD